MGLGTALWQELMNGFPDGAEMARITVRLPLQNGLVHAAEATRIFFEDLPDMLGPCPAQGRRLSVHLRQQRTGQPHGQNVWHT